jgi:hypothetical protein
LPKCFKEFIEKQTEGEKDRLREIYTDSNGSKNAIHRVLDKIDFETGEIIITYLQI